MARLVHTGIKFLCSKKRENGTGPLSKKAALEFVEIFEAVTTSLRPPQMPQELYEDLMSLPLDLVWHNLLALEPNNSRVFDWSPLEKIFNWIQPNREVYEYYQS